MQSCGSGGGVCDGNSDADLNGARNQTDQHAKASLLEILFKPSIYPQWRRFVIRARLHPQKGLILTKKTFCQLKYKAAEIDD